MIQALIGPIANLAGTWFQNKIEKTKADGSGTVTAALPEREERVGGATEFGADSGRAHGVVGPVELGVDDDEGGGAGRINIISPCSAGREPYSRGSQGYDASTSRGELSCTNGGAG